MVYQGDMDPECIELCDAMNLFPGITTVDSCCGHTDSPYHIFFNVEYCEDLPRLLYYFSECHCGFGGWRVDVYTDCSMAAPCFCLEGPKGPLAFEQALSIAKLLRKELTIARQRKDFPSIFRKEEK